VQSFEYDRAGTVLALAIQYSRRHLRKELRGESFLVLESSQVLIPIFILIPLLHFYHGSIVARYACI